jgi:hypothetical protein
VAVSIAAMTMAVTVGEIYGVGVVAVVYVNLLSAVGVLHALHLFQAGRMPSVLALDGHGLVIMGERLG